MGVLKAKAKCVCACCAGPYQGYGPVRCNAVSGTGCHGDTRYLQKCTIDTGHVLLVITSRCWSRLGVCVGGRGERSEEGMHMCTHCVKGMMFIVLVLQHDKVMQWVLAHPILVSIHRCGHRGPYPQRSKHGCQCQKTFRHDVPVLTRGNTLTQLSLGTATMLLAGRCGEGLT